MKHLLFFLLLCVLLGCQPVAEKSEDPILASVGNKKLFLSDLEGIGKGLTVEDSTAQIDNQIKKWVRDQLMLNVARANINSNAKIAKMVDAYEETLIMSEYEEALINERLNTEISTLELADYYKEHKDQYISGISWIRCHFIMVDRNAPDLKQLKKWFKSESGVDFEKVKLFCAKNNTNHILNEDLWVEYDQILASIPPNSITSRHREKQVVLDRTDDTYQYLLQIFEYRDKDDATPLPQLTEEISRIIIHQRRNKIIQEIRNEVYEKAKKESNFTIHER